MKYWINDELFWYIKWTIYLESGYHKNMIV